MFVFLLFQPVEAGHEHNFIPTDVNTFPVKRENGKLNYIRFPFIETININMLRNSAISNFT